MTPALGMPCSIQLSYGRATRHDNRADENAANVGVRLRSGEPWHEDYECSSPDVYRLFHAVTYPIGDAQGLLCVHSLRLERPHTHTPEVADLALFANEHGFFAQCAYCRRFRLAGQPQRWSWVPEWLRSRPPAPVTHGICPPCRDHHFGKYLDKT